MNDASLATWLEEHPAAIFGACDDKGAVVEMPATIVLPPGSHIDGRSTLELVIAEDYRTVIDAFVAALTEGFSSATIHMASDPDTAVGLRYLDLRAEHGVILRVVMAIDREDDATPREIDPAALSPRRPRIGSMTKDENAVIISVDIAASLMLGWSEEEMVGHSNLEFIHPDDYLKAIDNWMARLGDDEGPVAHTVRLRYRCKDGTWLWLETSNQFQSQSDGTKLAVAQLVNVSEEMEAVELLRESRERFHTLVSSSSDVIALVNDKGELLYANPAGEQMFGYDASEEIGRSLLELIHPGDREATAAAFSMTLGTPGVHSHYIFRIRGSTGEWRTIEAIATNCTDDPAVAGVVLNARDITERKRTERLSALGELATVVGHELRNPLGAAINGLFLARGELGQISDEAERYLSGVERAVNRAVRLSEDLTAYMREREPDFSDVDFADLVADVLQTTPPPEGVEVHIDSSERIKVDPCLMTQVLTNLITNAYQAMPDGGIVSLAATCDPTPRITVQDSGSGFDSDLAHRLFDPFFTTKIEGTGLGLAIVQRLVEVQGASVSIENAAGGGAKLSIAFPRTRGS
ncbi:MAG TPA: PAS domain S-box protein [Acidimicrobiales bacterium]|nr:PAS domain S-box protein [Acidimicrobiales bacterium]